MKLKSNEIAGFIRRPPEHVRAILIYGPDGGQVREISDQIAKTVVENLADPFQVADLVPESLKDEPSRIADEAAAISLTGGRRLVRLRGATDTVTASAELALGTETGDSLVIIEAGALEARSKLRKLFETEKHAAAIPCYLDSGAGLDAVIRETLASFEVRATPDALAYMIAHLGGDRRVTRSEIEKLALYVGKGGEASLEDAQQLVGDSSALALDQIALAVASGDVATADRMLQRGYADGLNAIAVLRAVLRHFQRLHRAAAHMADGDSADQAVQKLRPPLFFAVKPAFMAQLRAWPIQRLRLALTRLAEAETQCKSTGTPDLAVAGQTLLGLAYSAARSRARAPGR
ncbi:DNA polymerase III subunit delta [Nisaea sediminum]|uniref:DNA polymerase III subunit delta n=1 Tax=Nisaea sediminum TaxID=2775867 RepID=UPI001865F5F4|nr:DNA polymerase III subunit delta [Nisaea sediminum]